MATDDERWNRLRNALSERLGNDVTDDLLAQFPPDGWGDVARSHEVVALSAHIDQVEARVSSLDTRVSSLDTRVSSLDTRVSSLEVKVDQVETRLTSLEAKMDQVDARMTSLEKVVLTHIDTVKYHLGVLDGRLKLLIGTGIALLGAVMAIQVQTLFVMTGL